MNRQTEDIKTSGSKVEYGGPSQDSSNSNNRYRSGQVNERAHISYLAHLRRSRGLDYPD